MTPQARAGVLGAQAGAAAAAGETDRAAALYGQAIETWPAGAPPLKLRLALALLAAERIGTALAVLEELTRSVPRSASAWQALGAALRDRGDPDGADRAFSRALALAPDYPLAHLGRAQAAVDLGRPSDPLFERALRADPGSAQARLAAAAAHAGAGRPERAEALLRAWLRADPGWADGWTTLASITNQARGREAFVAVLDEALRARPGDAALALGGLRALAAAGEHAGVLARLGPVRAAIGDPAPLRLLEAEALSETGQGAAADPLFAALAPLGEPVVDLARVRHALRMRRPDEAARIAAAFRPDAARFAVPYLGAAWRLLDDPRWHWLEGDGRLVGTYPIAGDAAELAGLADALRALHRTRFAPHGQSMRGGTQTEGALLGRENPAIRTLRSRLEAAVRRHIDALPPPDPAHPTLAQPRGPFRFSGSWSVRLTDGGAHVNHVHSEGWFSSALHVALPPAVADPCAPGQEGWLALGQPPAELGLDLPPARVIRPVAGQLILFPSTMWHGTIPFADGERLTVAFDVKPLR